MRDLGMELRGLAAEEGGIPVLASNVADAVARRAGKRRLVKRSAVGAGSALAVGGIAVAGLLEAVRGEVGPVAAPVQPPGPETFVAAAYNPEAMEQAFYSTSFLPGCGEAADIEPRAAHGVSLTIEQWPNANDPEYIAFLISVQNDSTEHLTFIATNAAVVLVKDGVMASDPNAQLQNLVSYDVAPGATEAPPAQFLPEYLNTCAGAEALQNLDRWLDDPRAESEEERAASNAAFWEVVESPLPAGDYTAYAWTPVIFGEQAGAARVWREAGFPTLNHLNDPSQRISPLYGDSSLTQYCYVDVTDPDTGEVVRWEGILPDDPDAWTASVEGVPGSVGGYGCDVPQDVVADRLRRLVPESYINDYEMTYIVSEPITFTVE